jgi:hypothetical protein
MLACLRHNQCRSFAAFHPSTPVSRLLHICLPYMSVSEAFSHQAIGVDTRLPLEAHWRPLVSESAVKLEMAASTDCACRELLLWTFA